MALHGRFGDTSGRPYIEGRLVIPRLNVTTNISFLVDTGADATVLMPLDARRAGVDYRALRGSKDVGGVGGAMQMFEEPALVAFFDDSGTGVLHVYDITVLIAPDAPDLTATPSLLGRNILDRWRIVYAPSEQCLECEVLSADLSEPLTP